MQSIATVQHAPLGHARVAVLDIDYHHGNGSELTHFWPHAITAEGGEAQDIFYEDSSVLYVSLHAEKDYPCA